MTAVINIFTGKFKYSLDGYRMISNAEMKLYVSNKTIQIRTICRTSQWSGITESDVHHWMNGNFRDIEGRYIATKLLTHSLYYSEQNLISLLKSGIYQRILGSEIKDHLILNNNIYQPITTTNAVLREQLNKTLFIPLSDSKKPSESGNLMIRYLIHKLGVKSSNVNYHFDVQIDKLNQFNRIIILDDCVGSGYQIDDFWNYDSEMQQIKDMASSLRMPIYYLTLVAYETNIHKLQLDEKLLGLKLVVCDKLNDNNRVFYNGNTEIWNTTEEHKFASEYLDNIERSIGVKKLGYNDLDFMVIMHNTTPDWTLPVFWTENSNWTPLLKRKNSNY